MTFHCFFLHAAIIIDFAMFNSPRLSNIAAITHVVYSPNTFDFTANILRVLVCIVNMVVINHDVLVAKPLLCHTVSFMEISKSLDLVFELF